MVSDELFLVSTGLVGTIRPLRVGWRPYLEAGFASCFLDGWQRAAFLSEDTDAVAFYLRQLQAH